MIFKQTEAVEQFLANDHTLIREILHPLNDRVEMSYSLAHGELEPGKSSLPHRLMERSEVYYFLSGNGFIIVDSIRKPVKAGDTVLVPPSCVQHVENKGNTSLKFLCIVSPPWTGESDRAEK